jgi:hypothetical protein
MTDPETNRTIRELVATYNISVPSSTGSHGTRFRYCFIQTPKYKTLVIDKKAIDGKDVLTGTQDDETTHCRGIWLQRRLAVAPQHVDDADGEQGDEYRKGAARGSQSVEGHRCRSRRDYEIREVEGGVG